MVEKHHVTGNENLALGLVTSYWSRVTASWRPASCWLRCGSPSICYTSKNQRKRGEFKKEVSLDVEEITY